ncbi:unnamed protein product [Dicrocoelium dendriticum]|nr:unnamed protein product [Dicrocoelium dendriticum]
MIPRPIVDDRLTLWSHTLSTSPTSRVDSNKETDSELTYRPTSIRGFVDDAPNILRHEQQHAYVEKRRQLLGSGLDEETLNQNGDRDSSKNSQAHVILEEELRREQLASSMIGMTRHLKDQSLAMSDRLQSDRKTVEDSIVQTTKNQATLSVVMNQLSEELGSRCARTVWIALFLSLILFFQMIAFMKIFRRRSRWYYGTARTEL